MDIYTDKHGYVFCAEHRREGKQAIPARLALPPLRQPCSCTNRDRPTPSPSPAAGAVCHTCCADHRLANMVLKYPNASWHGLNARMDRLQEVEHNAMLAQVQLVWEGARMGCLQRGSMEAAC